MKKEVKTLGRPRFKKGKARNISHTVVLNVKENITLSLLRLMTDEKSVSGILRKSLEYYYDSIVSLDKTKTKTND